MGLRYPVTILRRAAGAYVSGRWVAGTAGAPETILATVQPARLVDYDELEPLPEGRRVEALVRVYTAEPLEIAGEDPGSSGDLLEWPDGLRTGRYVFMARSPWQSRIIPHYRYLAALIPPPRPAA